MIRVESPAGWSTAPLETVAKLDRKTITPERIPAGVTYVGLEHIDGEGRFLAPPSVGEGDLNSTKFEFSDQHILYGKLRPYLRKIAAPTFGGVCTTELVPILPGPRVDRSFLLHYLRQPKLVEFATERCAGANLPRLSPKLLAKFPVILPPLPEQRRIAAILDRADAIRRKRRQAIELTEELLRSVFLEMFGDPVTNPKGWPTRPLGELIAEGPKNGLYRPASDYGSGTPIVRIDSFSGGDLVDLSRLKRARMQDEVIEAFAVRPGDLLINRVNAPSHLGKSALVPALSEPTVFESNMMRFRLKEELANARFVLAQLQDQWVRGQIRRLSRDAVNQSSINQQDVRSLELRLPPLTRQLDFVSTTQKVEGLRTRFQELQSSDDNLFQSLAQRAFRGEL